VRCVGAKHTRTCTIAFLPLQETHYSGTPHTAGPATDVRALLSTTLGALCTEEVRKGDCPLGAPRRTAQARNGRTRPHREGNLRGQHTHGQQGSSQARTRRGEHRAPQPPKGKEATCAYTAQRALRTPVGNLQPKAARAQAVAKVQRSHGGRRTMTWMPTDAPRGRDALKPIRRIQTCAARNEPSRWKGGAWNSTTRTVPCSRRARA